MTRAEDRRSWDAAVVAAATDLGWKQAGGGYVYRPTAAYVFEMHAPVATAGRSRVGEIRAKPRIVDPVFWDLIGRPELERKRIGFRVNGGPVAPMLTVDAIESTPDADVSTVVGGLHRLFESAEPSLRSVADFRSVVERHLPARNGFDLVTVVAWLIATDQTDEAERLLRSWDPDQVRGGFSFPAGSFEDLAYDRLGLQDERGHHVELIDGGFRRIFPGVRWSFEDRLAADLRAMDGDRRFALAFWPIPDVADRRVVDDRWDAPEYIQCAGGPDRFLIEIRRSSDGRFEHLAVGRGDDEAPVDVRRGNHVSTVATSETFTAEETREILEHHLRHGELPGGLTLRSVDVAG